MKRKEKNQKKIKKKHTDYHPVSIFCLSQEKSLEKYKKKELEVSESSFGLVTPRFTCDWIR